MRPIVNAPVCSRGRGVCCGSVAILPLLTMRTPFIALLSLLVLLSACTSASSDTDDGEPLDSIEISQPMRTGGELIDPVHGKEISLWYGAVAGVNGVNANGVAFIHLFQDGVATVTANVNILPAPQGTSFEVRLTDAASARTVVIGPLESIVGDARHIVKGDTRENVASLLRFLVVRKQGSTETVVAEGDLKLPAKAQKLSQ